jgi:hypothetical protein
MNGIGLALSRAQLKIMRDHAARILPPSRQRYLAAISDQLTSLDVVDDATVCRRMLARMPSGQPGG